MTIMSRIGDLMVLNLLYLLTCVPIITIGAATTALYSVCFKFDTDQYRGLIRDYFSAFGSNFKQATILWLIILLCGVCSIFNILFFISLPGWISFLFVVFCILLAIVLLVFSYAFPLQSRFENKVGTTLKNALILGLGYLPRSIVMTALTTLPVVLLLVNFLTFLQAAFLWVALYFAAAAYANTFLLRKVFAPYLPKPEEEEE